MSKKQTKSIEDMDNWEIREAAKSKPFYSLFIKLKEHPFFDDLRAYWVADYVWQSGYRLEIKSK